MQGSEYQLSTALDSPEVFAQWQDIVAHHGQDAGFNFVCSELEKVANSGGKNSQEDGQMTLSSKSTETGRQEGSQVSLYPVPEPSPSPLMNNQSPPVPGMTDNVHENQAFLPNNTVQGLVPNITITDNDTRAAMYNSGVRASFEEPLLGPGRFSGSATPTTTAYSVGAESAYSGNSQLALPLEPESEELPFSIMPTVAKVSKDARQGGFLVSDQRTPPSESKRVDTQNVEQEQEQAGGLAPQGQFLRRRRKLPSLETLYKRAVRSEEARIKGCVEQAHLYKYDAYNGTMSTDWDGFVALSALHHDLAQSWAARYLTVEVLSVTPRSDAQPRSKETETQEKYNRTFEGRESYCGKALSAWYSNLLKRLSTMTPKRAKEISIMTISNIIESQTDIAEMISWENLKTFLTENAQRDPVQTIIREPVVHGKRQRPGWEVSLTYATKPTPHCPPSLRDS